VQMYLYGFFKVSTLTYKVTLKYIINGKVITRISHAKLSTSVPLEQLRSVNLEQTCGGLHLSIKSVRWPSYSNNILCTNS